MAINNYSQLVDRHRNVRLKPGPRLSCGHEASQANTIWLGKGKCKCKRCADIMKILAAFDEMEKA